MALQKPRNGLVIIKVKMLHQNAKHYQSSVYDKEFYDGRYAKGYMEAWPIDKKTRVFEVIKGLHLPEKGEALDFGCGNGVFTQVLKQALPHWRVYGCDISEIAVGNAKRNNPGCTFFVEGSRAYQEKKFDFIFSHHVLEHVLDIKETVLEITGRTNNNASMLHILPCGNRDSFEWQICQLVNGGIDEKRGNVFFFEYEGHLRRMTTESCVFEFKNSAFMLKQAFYSNQYYGALNWITRSNPLVILKMFNPIGGESAKAKLTLMLLLCKFIVIAGFRLPYVAYQRFDSFIVKFLFFIPSYSVSIFIDKYIIKKSNQEWEKYKTDSNGSEMYLYFTR